jgi:hypothetical protein
MNSGSILQITLDNAYALLLSKAATIVEIYNDF